MNVKKALFLLVSALVLVASLGVIIGCGEDKGTNNLPKIVTVSFDANGGSPNMISSVSVESGKPLGTSSDPLPADPTRAGYTFAGWFYETTQYTAASVIRGETTLTAGWIRHLTVWFDANGGSPDVINSVTVDSGKALGAGSDPFPASPAREGYTFAGWFYETAQYTASAVITGDITLTAGWIRHLTVSFDANGGSPNAINPVTVDSGKTLESLPTAVMKGGFVFDGWFDGDEQYTAGAAITKSVTLTAKWGEIFVDARDGREYRVATIGNQTWMAENLHRVANDSRCYDNADSNCAIYGRLYAWNAARTACPAGWRLPSKADWNALVQYAGGSSIAGKKLKAKSGWNNNGNGTDDYGFAAMPGGISYGEGSFSYVGYSGRWWSASEVSGVSTVTNFYVDDDVDGVVEDANVKDYGFSVRCIRD